MKEDKYYEDLESKGYFEKLDKRSKEYRDYKEWKSSNDYKALKENVDKENTVGLGDVVEKITEATGIKKVVESITDDCGCDERKEKFNKIPLWRRRKVRCIDEEDYKWLKDYLGSRRTKYTFEERERIVKIYNHIFRTKVKNSKCYPCIKGYLDNLKQYLSIYEN
jgi:hypothetical protein